MAEMQVSFNVTLPTGPLLEPDEAMTIIRREVGTGLTAIVEDIATRARANTPVDTGILRASIATRVTPGQEAGVLVRGEVFTGAQAPYAIYVEAGTRPHWPPRAPIEAWARRKLGDASLWFVVARAIARRGTRAHWMFRDAWQAVQETIQPRLQAAADRAASIINRA